MKNIQESLTTHHAFYKLPSADKKFIVNNQILRKNLLVNNKYGGLNKLFMNSLK